MTREQLRAEQAQARHETSMAALIGGKIEFVSPGRLALCQAPSGRVYGKDSTGAMRRMDPRPKGKAARKAAKRARRHAAPQLTDGGPA